MAVAEVYYRNESPQSSPTGAIKLRDRSKEFRRAVRHSTRVRVLKVLLPAAALGILSLYIIPGFLSFTIDDGKGKATVRAITLEAGALKMLNPRVQGVNDKQGIYDIVADSATQQSKNADVMLLVNIRGKLISDDGKQSTLTAPDGLYNNKLEEMTFNNGAFVTREPGMTAQFQTATIYMKQELVISKTPVVVRLHDSTIHAQGMTLYMKEQRAVFEGNVKTHIERQGQTDGQPESVPANNQ